MKVLSFTVHGLFGRSEPISADLNPDLNVMTGRNGAGKTTIMKLLWYVMSGNLLMATKEVPFSRLELVTDLYSCVVTRLTRVTCRVEFTPYGKSTAVYEDLEDDEGEVYQNAEDLANPQFMVRGSSIFLPTFRRIEGGFSLNEPKSGFGASNALFGSGLLARPKNDLEQALQSLASKVSNRSHNFVTSISTVDVVEMLLTRYTDISEQANDLQREVSQRIIDSIKEYKSEASGDTDKIVEANTVIDNIRAMVEEMDVGRENLMSSIEAVRYTVERLFKYTGIEFDKRLRFGDAAKSVASDALSAGEKQMLSFICYNAFSNEAVIFIDEPELSLHVDWQRQLFSILQSQNSSNQFIVATHSPFIYSKYPDKEIVIDSSRGDEGEAGL